MQIQTVAEQYGFYDQMQRVAAAGIDHAAMAAVAARTASGGITAGLNDPRGMQRQAMPAPRGTDPQFTPRQEGGPHGDIYKGDGDWFSDYGMEPDDDDRARWQDATRQRNEALQSYIDQGGDPYAPGDPLLRRQQQEHREAAAAVQPATQAAPGGYVNPATGEHAGPQQQPHFLPGQPVPVQPSPVRHLLDEFAKGLPHPAPAPGSTPAKAAPAATKVVPAHHQAAGPSDYHSNDNTWDRHDPEDPMEKRCKDCGGVAGRHDPHCRLGSVHQGGTWEDLQHERRRREERHPNHDEPARHDWSGAWFDEHGGGSDDDGDEGDGGGGGSEHAASYTYNPAQFIY